MESNPNEPTFLYDNLPLHWQMTRCEKYAFGALLDAAKPEVAIEIGTYKGGSLQMLAARAGKVYSLDLSSRCKVDLESRFPNVEFLTGDSKELLPLLLADLEARGESLGFVLIDGDHSAEGVRGDINAVLSYTPIRPCYLVFHDSFHPPSREGILMADWHSCPFIHYVEVDFVPGVYHAAAFDTAKPHSMYGGLAVALMLPRRRTNTLRIHQSQKGLFDLVLPRSRHKNSATAVSAVSRRMIRWLTG